MLKKPGLEELVRELERDYARWEQVYMAGSKDPFWPDGVNANLCRNHILCGKRRIRELYAELRRKARAEVAVSRKGAQIESVQAQMFGGDTGWQSSSQNGAI